MAPTTQLEFTPKWQPLELPSKPRPWTPIPSFLCERELSSYPDKVFVKQLIHDLQLECNIGYTGLQFTHLVINLASAHQQPNAIDATLKKECEAGHILGPFQTPPFKIFHTSGLGVIPKYDGGWRIIYHLSPPDGCSISDFIDPFTCSLTFCSIDDAYTIINKLGPGIQLCWLHNLM